MYNTKRLDEFFERIHEEATQAAQDVYNMHTNELKDILREEINEGEKLEFGMGMVSLENSENCPDKFLHFLAQNTEYWDKCSAGFNIDEISK